MLTRLRVKGFKNLVDTEVRFGPFTCIAGPNGVGKSNLFDAIRFLALLADRSFVEAARESRGSEEDITRLFTAGGQTTMEFDCDLLIQPDGVDDFGQPARASYTYLQYRLRLGLADGHRGDTIPRIRLKYEDLSYIVKTGTKARLGFPHKKAWRDSVLTELKRRKPFISTENDPEDERTTIRLHQDRMRDDSRSRRGGGQPTEFAAESIPRTVLSSAHNAAEFRTAVLVRKEMRAWRHLQLEPTALRETDPFFVEPQMSPSGRHLPATLFRLADADVDPDQVYAEVANRLSELVNGVDKVWVVKDRATKRFCLMMSDLRGTVLPAGSLSDGTLRFLALAVLERDDRGGGLICLEEPENGIHPLRVNAMVRLLTDQAVDPTLPCDAENPLRQVIVSTHSPVVVNEAGDNPVVFARWQNQSVEVGTHRRTLPGLVLLGLDGTWRHKTEKACVAKGTVLNYLNAARGQLRFAVDGDGL